MGLFITPCLDTLRLPASFEPFSPLCSDPARMLETYRRNLPHWRHEGATYFVTFRLNDAVPQDVMEDMKAEAEAWERRMEEADDMPAAELLKKWEDFHQVRFRKLEAIMDAGQGSCHLRDRFLRNVVARALRHFECERSELFASCVMPNHVHMACRPLPGWPLEELLKSWKAFTANQINGHLGRSGQLWQRESYDRIVRDGAHLARVVRYIARNPAKARLREDNATVWLAPAITGGSVA